MDYAIIPEAGDVAKILDAGGYGIFLAPVEGRRGVRQISKREIVNALKYW